MLYLGFSQPTYFLLFSPALMGLAALSDWAPLADAMLDNAGLKDLLAKKW